MTFRRLCVVLLVAQLSLLCLIPVTADGCDSYQLAQFRAMRQRTHHVSAPVERLVHRTREARSRNSTKSLGIEPEAASTLNGVCNNRFQDQLDTCISSVSRAMIECAYMESMCANVAQSPSGPGRGYFQYEMQAGGGSGANMVAINRAINQLGSNAPDWLTGLQGQDVDFTDLTMDQQEVIFILDKNADPQASYGSLIDAWNTDGWEYASCEFWLLGHHKGPDTRPWDGANATPDNCELDG